MRCWRPTASSSTRRSTPRRATSTQPSSLEVIAAERGRAARCRCADVIVADRPRAPAPGRAAPPADRGLQRRPWIGRLVRPGAHVPQGDRAGPAAHRRRRGRYSRSASRPGRPRRRSSPTSRPRASSPRSTSPSGASCSALVQRRRGRQAGPHPGQPAPRRVDRQALRRAGDALPRPHPGGQPRPDAGGREVRLHEGLQVLHLRHVVDPPGHHPGHRRPGPHDPHPGAHGRVDQQGAPGAAPDAAGARARADRRGAGREGRHDRATGCARSMRISPGPAVARLAGGGGGRLQPRRLHRGPAGRGAGRGRRPARCSTTP